MNSSDILKKNCIAITGGICTGKSSVGRILRELQFKVIDSDQLARLAVAPGSRGLNRIAQHFGSEFVNDTGELNRQKMAEFIFADPAERRTLESILHPEIRNLLLEQATLWQSEPFWFYEVPLLYEANLENDFLEIWCTWCPPETQLQRIQKRDNIPLEQAVKRLASQMPAGEKAARADVRIPTNVSKEDLLNQITELTQKN